MSINDLNHRKGTWGFKEQYENLKLKDISRISLGDIEPDAYKSGNISPLFTRYSRSIIKSLIDKGLLRITPSYAKGVVSVTR